MRNVFGELAGRRKINNRIHIQNTAKDPNRTSIYTINMSTEQNPLLYLLKHRPKHTKHCQNETTGVEPEIQTKLTDNSILVWKIALLQKVSALFDDEFGNIYLCFSLDRKSIEC